MLAHHHNPSTGESLMNRFRSVFLPLVLLVSALLVIEQAGALSIRELLGLDDKQEPAKASPSDQKQNTAKKPATGKQDWAKTREVKPATSLEFADIQKMFANLNASQRQNYLKDASTFRQLVKQEADNLSVLEAAISNNVDEDENIRYLMKRGSENILRESYLKKLMANKIPKDFPTDQQLREYYDKNKEQFVIEQRIHVWQVYLQIDQDMDKKALASLQKKANTIIKEIQQGKLDFATAAIKYSEHAQSKANGGYMGLLKVSELKPEITKPLLALAEGKISQAIKTDSGWHILKRGAIIPKQDVSLEQVRAQVQNLLKKQVITQLGQAIYQQAGQTYPVELNDNKVEEWRLRLRTNTGGELGKK